MTFYTPGEVALRKENVDEVIKNIAARKFLMKKKLVSVMSSSAWEESYYRESIKTLEALTEVPRLATFPADEVEWEKNTSRMKKYGLESVVSWEDAMTNRIDVIGRTLFRIGNRIATLVDQNVYNTISENQSASTINTVAAGATWNNATRSSRIPHEDIAKAWNQIVNSNLNSYVPDTLCLSPLDYIYVVTNDYVMDSFDASGPDVMKSGFVGTLLGMDVLVSPVVANDSALVAQAKICGTWKQAQDLTTETIEDKGKGYTLRGWEIGTCQLTDPKAVCLITNTQA